MGRVRARRCRLLLAALLGWLDREQRDVIAFDGDFAGCISKRDAA